MAEWTSAYISDLPDSAFACPDERKYPHHDASGKLDLPHLRAALSRVGDPSNDQCGKGHLQAHAREAGIGAAAKALMPLLSQPLVDAKAFLEGREPWRMLGIPFGGPIPSPKSPRGVDLDGQFFSERTDIYGEYAQLKATRDRVVDWHHSLAPVNNRGGDPRGGLMNGVALGKAVLDEQPDEAGWWADFWVTVGEKKRALLDRLVERATSLYASAQPVSVAHTKADPLTGEILTYPVWAVTITTSPQNHLAVVNPKALLAELDSDEITVSPALRGLLAELDALGADLPQTFRSGGEAAAKAGDVSPGLTALNDALGTWEALRDRLRAGRTSERKVNDA